MARITVEDCLDNVENRFELVLVAAKRARDISRRGLEPLVPVENDKPTVIALREIAANLVDARVLDDIQPEASQVAPVEPANLDLGAQQSAMPRVTLSSQGAPELFSKLPEVLLKQDSNVVLSSASIQPVLLKNFSVNDENTSAGDTEKASDDADLSSDSVALQSEDKEVSDDADLSSDSVDLQSEDKEVSDDADLSSDSVALQSEDEEVSDDVDSSSESVVVQIEDDVDNADDNQKDD